MNDVNRLSNLIKKFTEEHSSIDADTMAKYLIDNSVLVLPCKVGDDYYTIEAFCTEGGYFDEPQKVSTSDCEYCEVGGCYGGTCDKYHKIEKHCWYSINQIVNKMQYIDDSIFLSKAKAENMMCKGK